MKGGEANLWKRMWTGIALFAFAQRIENMVGSGVPDVILHSRDSGRCAMIELKARMIAPVRANTPIFSGSYGLRPEQISWIHSRAVAGAAIYVLGQCADEVWLVHGRFARDLASMTRGDLDLLADWTGLARRTDWGGMLGAIFGDDYANISS